MKGQRRAQCKWLSHTIHGETGDIQPPLYSAEEILRSLSATGIVMVSGVARVKSMGSSCSSSAIMYRRSESSYWRIKLTKRYRCFGKMAVECFRILPCFAESSQYFIKVTEHSKMHSPRVSFAPPLEPQSPSCASSSGLRGPSHPVSAVVRSAIQENSSARSICRSYSPQKIASKQFLMIIPVT